jgi:hypothetical protein
MLGMAKIFKTIDCIWIGFQKGNIYSICAFFTHTQQVLIMLKSETGDTSQ